MEDFDEEKAVDYLAFLSNSAHCQFDNTEYEEVVIEAEMYLLNLIKSIQHG
jgi:hypothetical protein